MNKKLKIIGGLFLLVIISCLAVGGYAKYTSNQFLEKAIPYIKEITPALVTWDKEKWRKYFAPEAKFTLDQPQADIIFKAFQKLGKFESAEEPTEIHFFAGVDGSGISAKATYGMKSKFENGDAELIYSLIGRGDQIELLGLNVNSPVLLK